MHKVKA